MLAPSNSHHVISGLSSLHRQEAQGAALSISSELTISATIVCPLVTHASKLERIARILHLDNAGEFANLNWRDLD